MVESRVLKFFRLPMWEDYPGLREQAMEILLAQSENPAAVAACLHFWFHETADPEHYVAAYMEEHNLQTAADWARHVFGMKHAYPKLIKDHCAKVLD
jgi:hypothetical protein